MKTSKSKTHSKSNSKIKLSIPNNLQNPNDSQKPNESLNQKPLSIESLIKDKTPTAVFIIYNTKPYGYFTLGNNELVYYGERHLKLNTTSNNLYKKQCINITFDFKKKKIDKFKKTAYLGNFFYNRKSELCLTKNNIKPPDMFPLFDIFIQELKINILNLYDAATLHLKYCNYNLGLLGLLEKNYTYYNKFGFFKEII